MATDVAILQMSPNKLQPYQDPESARTIACVCAPNLTVARGTIMGRITTSRLVTPRNTGASDGSQTAELIAAYDFQTDANGVISTAPSGTVDAWFTGGLQTLPFYQTGKFLIADLTGYASGVVTELNARLIDGGTVLELPR